MSAATYKYKTTTGETVEIDRVEPGRNGKKKDFVPYHFTPAGRRELCKADAHGKALRLYREEEMLAADPRETVYLVEGEGKCDLLRSLGLVAVSKNGGAMRKWEPHQAAALRGRRVAMLRDFNAAGATYAENTTAALRGVARICAAVTLPGVDQGVYEPEEDVAQWIESGMTVGQLTAHAESLLTLAAMEAVPEDEDSITGTLADVEEEEVEWIWPGRIARGKFTIFDGVQDLGKSLTTLDLTARLVTGRAMPGETAGGAPVDVLLMSCEDGLADTVKPRLLAAGADDEALCRVHYFKAEGKKGEIDPSLRDWWAIEKVVKRHNVAVIFMDPISQFWGDGVNAHKDQDVRGVLSPFTRMQQRTGVALVAVRHLTKNQEASALNAGGGSVGIMGAARAAFLFQRDGSEIVVAKIKSNLWPGDLPALTYRIESNQDRRPFIAWGATRDVTAQGVLDQAAEKKGKKASVAEEWLRGRLANGPKSAKDLIEQWEEMDGSATTLRRAIRKIGTSVKAGFEDGWCWKLNEPF